MKTVYERSYGKVFRDVKQLSVHEQMIIKALTALVGRLFLTGM